MDIKTLTDRNYTPYSGRQNIAFVRSENGTYFPGVRIENISFPLTITAAQNAVFCCLSEGHEPEILFMQDKASEQSNCAQLLEEYGLEQRNINRLTNPSFEPVLLSLDEEEIYPALKKRLDNSYVEASQFPVAALLETEDGFISGMNIEMSEWNLGLCAERVALAKAISYGCTNFKGMHITTRHGEYNSPCGACRQVIVEHLPHHPVYLHYADGSRSMHYSSDLLPYSFQSAQLQNKR